MTSKTRQLKVECDNPDCAFIFRTSELQLKKLFRPDMERPWCPACDRGNLHRSQPKEKQE